jgi:hypothetical protein
MTENKDPIFTPDERLTAREFSDRDPRIASVMREIMEEKLSEPGELNLATWADLDKVLGPIEWEWQDWLPKGMLAILASESGIGKSALLLRLADCYLRGSDWPDGTVFTGETGAVLWCEAEAAQAINLARAKAWGLPLDNLYTPLDNPLDDLKLSDAAHVGLLAMKAQLPEVKLIIVDSLSGADAKAEKSVEDSINVHWLAELARNFQKPVIIAHHLRKRSLFDGDTINLDRLRGSSAIVQTARLVWAMDIPDPQTEDWKRLQVVKSNLAPFPEPVGVTWDNNSLLFGDSPEPPKVETIADKAADLLMALLRAEPMRATELQSEVEQAGMSWRSAQRAKEKLGIVSVKRDDGWYWSMPARDEDGSLVN